MTKETNSEQGSDPFAELVGQVAKGCWLGYGSVLFLEFGDRVAPEDLKKHKSGEYSLQCGEILWRIEHGDRVLAGSEDERPMMEAAINEINGRSFVSAEICGTTGDSILRFAGGVVLKTFVLTSEEDARWSFRKGAGEFKMVGPLLAKPVATGDILTTLPETSADDAE